MYRWPPLPTFTFLDGRGSPLSVWSDTNLDLSDTLMLWWPKETRTVQMAIRSGGSSWATWTEERLQHVERLIRYDLRFDGDEVSITRVTQDEDLPCSEDFTWKLAIRPAR